MIVRARTSLSGVQISPVAGRIRPQPRSHRKLTAAAKRAENQSNQSYNWPEFKTGQRLRSVQILEL
jgi:hypothetical protein